MKTMYQIVYKGVDINFLKDKEFVGYNFSINGEMFGYKVPLTTKKQVEAFAIITTLTQSALESVDLKTS